MIKIDKKKNCCGCTACLQRCPKQCITMQRDEEGFFYPVINSQLCINCNLCEKVCPVINQKERRSPIEMLAAINEDETTRLASSSGGIFSLYAEETIKQGGVVFGAAFNKNWEVEHIAVDTQDGLQRLRGSKYVQSNMGSCYKEAEDFLKKGRKVLFTGTPCQIAALKLFLRKDYTNLTTIDVVCHGVPSPLVWSKYLEETIEREKLDRGGKISVSSACGGGKASCIKSINFRSKITGWENFSFTIQPNFPCETGKNTEFFHEPFETNIFMRCFLANLCLRPSCYTCPARAGKSGSDITLGDLWGASDICPSLNDDKGTSLILSWNNSVAKVVGTQRTIEYSKALKYNPSIERDVATPSKRRAFFKTLHKKGVYAATIKHATKSKRCTLWDKIIWNIKNRLLKWK